MKINNGKNEISIDVSDKRICGSDCAYLIKPRIFSSGPLLNACSLFGSEQPSGKKFLKFVNAGTFSMILEENKSFRCDECIDAERTANEDK